MFSQPKKVHQIEWNIKQNYNIIKQNNTTTNYKWKDIFDTDQK